jgi:hypothetical protein
LGLTITTSGAKKADAFGDRLVLLQEKLAAIGRQIGQELVPTVERAADDIERWLKENQGEIIKTAKELGTLISEVYAFGKAVASPFIMQIVIMRRLVDIPAGGVAGVAGSIGASVASALGASSSDIAATTNAPGQLPQGLPTLSVFRRPGLGTFGSPFRNPAQPGTKPLDFSKPGGGRGGGGGKGRADDTLRDQKRLNDLLLSHFKDRLDAEENELAHSYDKRTILFQEYFDESNRLEEERYATVKANLQKEESAARVRVESGKGGLKAQLELQEAINASFSETVRHNERLAAIAREQREEQERIADSLERQADRLNDILLSSMERVDFGHMPTATEALEKLGEPPDISAQSQAILDMRERIRGEMVELGNDLTSVFARSVGDGFERGAKRGLQSLALGLLDIVQNIFLRKLAEGLGEIFSQLALGTGGAPSWLRVGLGVIAGGIGGGFGGGVTAGGNSGPVGSGIGNFAGGGFVPGTDKGFDSVPAMLRPGELVLNKQQQGMLGTTNIYNIQLPMTPKGSYSSPKSQREMANAVVAALQGAQT